MTSSAEPTLAAGKADPRPALALLLAVTAATCALGWLFKAHCAFDGQWGNLEFYETGCYSDAYPFWRMRHLAEGAIPYFDGPIEYPVLTGLLIFLEQRWTFLLFGRDAGDPDFLFVVSLANSALALLVTRQLWLLRLPAGRLWAWALAPPLVLYVGHNWDMLAVALAMGAFVAAERGQPVRACVYAALGTAAKLFPVLLLPLFALRRLAQGRIAEVTVLAAAAIAVWLAVNMPVALLAYDNWWEFYRFSSERAGTRASLWDLALYYGLFDAGIPARNLLSFVAFAAGLGSILWFGWKRAGDRLWLLAAPVLLWFLLTGKVYSPQFDLWAYPFVLVTARRWQPVALFVAGDIAAYFTELWYFAGLEGGFPAVPMEAILAAALVRAGAMLWLIADALRLPPPAWLERSTPAPA